VRRRGSKSENACEIDPFARGTLRAHRAVIFHCRFPPLSAPRVRPDSFRPTRGEVGLRCGHPVRRDPAHILAQPRIISVGTSFRPSQLLSILPPMVDELPHRICGAVDSLVCKLAQHVVPNRRVGCEKCAQLLETHGLQSHAMTSSSSTATAARVVDGREERGKRAKLRNNLRYLSIQLIANTVNRIARGY
jgi:hypothetical protein